MPSVPGGSPAPRRPEPTINGPLTSPDAWALPLWTPVPLPPPPLDFPKCGPPGTLPRTGLLSPSGVPHRPPGGMPSSCRGGETPGRRLVRGKWGWVQGGHLPRLPLRDPRSSAGAGQVLPGPSPSGMEASEPWSARQGLQPARGGQAGRPGGSESEVCQGPFGWHHLALQPVTGHQQEQ